jgi:hypothetical protein
MENHTLHPWKQEQLLLRATRRKLPPLTVAGHRLTPRRSPRLGRHNLIASVAPPSRPPRLVSSVVARHRALSIRTIERLCAAPRRRSRAPCTPNRALTSLHEAPHATLSRARSHAASPPSAAAQSHRVRLALRRRPPLSTTAHTNRRNAPLLERMRERVKIFWTE